MTEYPIFIPHNGEHVAAIVCLPDEHPRSMVLFIQGMGAPRSHRYGLWVRTARRLAERGIASVRFDYPQIGDSTGVFSADMESPPVDDAKAVLEAARSVLGVEEYGLIGNCIGLLAGLELAAQDPDCKSVVCLLKDPPKEVLVDRSTPNYQLTARQISRKMPRVRRFVRRFVHVKKGSFRHGLTREVAETMRTSDVLFLFTGNFSTGERLRAKVSRLHTQLQKEGRVGRAEVKTMEVAGTEQFQLPLTSHPLVVDAFVEWLTDTLSTGSRGGGLESRTDREKVIAAEGSTARLQPVRGAN